MDVLSNSRPSIQVLGVLELEKSKWKSIIIQVLNEANPKQK